jgi:hypothetical protein
VESKPVLDAGKYGFILLARLTHLITLWKGGGAPVNFLAREKTSTKLK